jgi:hypothetical protein
MDKKIKWKYPLVKIKKIKMKRNENYNILYKQSRSSNRVLYRLERFMRKNHLLYQGEYLEFVENEQKGLRIELITLVGFEAGFIEKDQYLKLVY